MKKLKLPVVKGADFTAKSLSMDDYLKFITLNLKYTFNKKAIRKQKKSQAVNAPFFL